MARLRRPRTGAGRPRREGREGAARLAGRRNRRAAAVGTRRPLRRVKRAAFCLLALLLAGCSRDGGDATGARFRVVVPDNNIREEGVECAGARPFRQIHRGTSFTVEDGEGEVVAEGELPAGRAENADPEIDW